MSGLPNITILTPTYNRKNVFKLAILNYLNIDYPRDNIEWIILDDSNEPMNEIIPKEKILGIFIFQKRIKRHYIIDFVKNIKKIHPENLNKRK